MWESKWFHSKSLDMWYFVEFRRVDHRDRLGEHREGTWYTTYYSDGRLKDDRQRNDADRTAWDAAVRHGSYREQGWCPFHLGWIFEVE
jgi:hypothetical protein